MKKIISFLIAAILLWAAIPASAAGNVTYSGNAGKFIFAPGSEYSPTDLFDDLKSVMPGDSLEQKITIQNKASKKVQTKIYLRALGAHEASKDFLSQLNLRVERAEGKKATKLFDAPANERAQLTDWVCLGTLHSGGEVDLVLTLDVPKELTNEQSEKIGYLDWQFKVEEIPIEKDPQTGDSFEPLLWLGLMGAAAGLMILLPLKMRKKENKN